MPTNDMRDEGGNIVTWNAVKVQDSIGSPLFRTGQTRAAVGSVSGGFNQARYYRDLTIDGAPDPRVVTSNSGRLGTGTTIPVWQTSKYPAVTTPFPVARYAEAQLIIAGARAAAGDLAGAATAINAARNSGRTGMPKYSVVGQTRAQVQAQIIEERRRELFLEGRRFWDVQRFDLSLVPAPGTPYLTTGTYGDQRCFPLPAVERNNNPHFS